ncbi:glutathione peroxidase [Actinospica robiniae]|uniref:glutathione peroxidase n=1 Tax=Actinospica robiniae TaxID=304901 RepID=UPI00040FB294|nr:glutathione peroxidase [Actinospica robiniae]
MSVSGIPIKSLQGEDTTIGAHLGKGALVVNVASKCGLTPQYTALEQLQKTYGERGFTVLGFPCNQFGGQEPGSAEEIETFCSTTFGVTFPMFEKVEVNGPGRHAVFTELTGVQEQESGEAGDVAWNFAKWLIDADGKPVARFSPRTTPDSPEVVEAIERLLG